MICLNLSENGESSGVGCMLILLFPFFFLQRCVGVRSGNGNGNGNGSGRRPREEATNRVASIRMPSLFILRVELELHGDGVGIALMAEVGYGAVWAE